jgi:hypothetical protein
MLQTVVTWIGVGIAHAPNREVILITENDHDIPFELRHLRYILYLNNAEGAMGPG